VCPVKINIPEILIHLRHRIAAQGAPLGERLAMKAAAHAFSSPEKLSTARMLGRVAQLPFVRGGRLKSLPGPASAWTATRDLPAVPAESFRQWWEKRSRGK
jgi:L-lactate dehydrogenase complex protein LldF